MILLAIPVVYVLSMGPMFWLAMRISSRPGPDVNWPKVVWHTVYAPVVFVARRDPQTRRVVSWYLSFWDLRAPAAP
ncbi:MAG TPA: hypothetical protein VHB77_08670 [Planctomycetaceae bacterium]|nr:hypothetical protein [Planctomycetaceae bacterium]